MGRGGGGGWSEGGDLATEGGASRPQVLAPEARATATATTMTSFWRPQHSQKTEIEKEKEKEIRIKKYSPKFDPEAVIRPV